jgi:Cft2 family RNA processing exonuclease
MAKVPLPDRGQPLDVTYLYQIANALNDAVDTISTATYNYTTVDTRGIGKEDVKNSNAKVYAAYKDIVTNETVSSSTTKTFSVDFSSEFKYPPIVTATAVNTGTSTIGNDVFAIITSVSTSRVEGVVRFNSSGNVSTSVNIIAIGLPA